MRINNLKHLRAFPMMLFFGICRLFNSITNTNRLPNCFYFPVYKSEVMELDPERNMEDYFNAINQGYRILLPINKASDRSYRQGCLLVALLFVFVGTLLGTWDKKAQTSMQKNAAALSAAEHRVGTLEHRAKHGSPRSRRAASNQLEQQQTKVSDLKAKNGTLNVAHKVLRVAETVAFVLAAILFFMAAFIRQWRRETVQARGARGFNPDYVVSVHMFSLNWIGEEELGLYNVEAIRKDKPNVFSRFRRILAIRRVGREKEEKVVWRWKRIMKDDWEYMYDFLASLQHHIFENRKAFSRETRQFSDHPGSPPANDPRMQK